MDVPIMLPGYKPPYLIWDDVRLLLSIFIFGKKCLENLIMILYVKLYKHLTSHINAVRDSYKFLTAYN